MLSAQNSPLEKGGTHRAFLFDFMRNLREYLSEPDSFSVNKTKFEFFFSNKTSKSIHNFISPKKNVRETVSPSKFINSVTTNFPDGLGLSYSEDDFKRVITKTNIFSKEFVYKGPIEYSGFRKDGSLLSYSNDQYYYVKQGIKRTSISRISDKGYYNRTYIKGVFRESLFVEPFFPVFFTTSNEYEYSSSESGNYDHGTLRYENSSEDFDEMQLFQGNKGVNIIYMVKHFLGFGLGFSEYNYTTLFEINFSGYELPYSMGYIPTLFSSGDDAGLKHKVVSSGFSTPFFMRLQLGTRYFSGSLDLGIGFTYKPQYKSYLTGSVSVYGYDPETGSLNTNEPSLGFGTFDYNNTLVNRIKSEKTLGYLLVRANVHIQPVRYAYIRLSSGFIGSEIDYKQSWHRFDMHSLRLPNALLKNRTMSLFTEIAIGFNVNELVLSFF
jgi:hypothetical protein